MPGGVFYGGEQRNQHDVILEEAFEEAFISAVERRIPLLAADGTVQRLLAQWNGWQQQERNTSRKHEMAQFRFPRGVATK